jgi:hypothetical protein
VIASRYLLSLCVLLGLALVPTIIHSYADDVARDGLTASVADSLAGYSGAPTDRNAEWGARRFDSDNWTERLYTRAGDDVRLTVVRSFDAKALYHHPELAIAYGVPFVGLDVRRFDARPDIPVFVLEPGAGVNAAGLYVLLYDGRFIDAPIRFQLRTAGELLFSSRKPMTLFFVLDSSASPPDIERSGAVQLLFAAIDDFQRQTPAVIDEP